MSGFKKIKEVVLFNEYGCEIAREPFENESQMNAIIKSWVVYTGDKIEVIERETEI